MPTFRVTTRIIIEETKEVEAKDKNEATQQTWAWLGDTIASYTSGDSKCVGSNVRAKKIKE